MSGDAFNVYCESCESELSVSEFAIYSHNGDIRCGKCRTVFYAPNHIVKGLFHKSKINSKKSDKIITVYADSIVTELLPSIKNADISDTVDTTVVVDPDRDPSVTTDAGVITRNFSSVGDVVKKDFSLYDAHEDTHASNKNSGKFYDYLKDSKECVSQNQYQNPEEAHPHEKTPNQSKSFLQRSLTQHPNSQSTQHSVHQLNQQPSGNPTQHLRQQTIHNQQDTYANKSTTMGFHNSGYQRALQNYRFNKQSDDLSVSAYKTPYRYKISNILTFPEASVKWSIACLFMVILLCGQYLWIKRSYLYNKKAFSLFYISACKIFPCGINKYNYLDKFFIDISMKKNFTQADRVRVASFTGAIVNRAYVRQRLPHLVVYFYDAGKNILDKQIMAPKDYIKNDSHSLLQTTESLQVEFIVQIPYNMHSYSVEIDKTLMDK